MAMPTPYAHGYLFQENGLSDQTDAMNPSWAWAAGAMISTVGDLLIWVKALEDGNFLNPETQRERMTMKDGVIEGWPISYGLGIYNDSGAVGHYGTYAGIYTSYCMRYQGYDFVVLENGELKEQHEAGRNPARSIFWNAVQDIGILQ
jgi:D-alanyl-D-alanine carboxypeptidase